MDSKITAEQLTSRMRNSALGSLARREHSCYELHQKLLNKFSDPQRADETLEWVRGLGYVDDQRFAGMFVRSAIAKGRGPERISRELQQRGVVSSVIDEALRDNAPDWLNLAQEVLRRKFPSPAQDYKEKAKQMRFLQYRGFSMSHISELM